MHIADKYMSLARDAMSSGDIVAAENYLQHAEHYNRFVMAAQAQAQPNQLPQEAPSQMNGNGRNGYPDFLYRDFQSGDDDDDDDEPGVNGYYSQPHVQPRPQQQHHRPHPQNQPQHQPQAEQPGFHDQQPAYADGAPRNLPQNGVTGDDDRQNARRPRRRRPAPNMNGQPRERQQPGNGDGGDEGGSPDGTLI